MFWIDGKNCADNTPMFWLLPNSPRAEDISSDAALSVRRPGVNKELGENTALDVLFSVSKHKCYYVIIPNEVVWFGIDLIIGRVFLFLTKHIHIAEVFEYYKVNLQWLLLHFILFYG